MLGLLLFAAVMRGSVWARMREADGWEAHAEHGSEAAGHRIKCNQVVSLRQVQLWLVAC